ncbi:Proteoglycan-4 [Pseudocyphellaria aurata]|nr:Proteoglycan-4 [Pseudocyphellaria aurata]
MASISIEPKGKSPQKFPNDPIARPVWVQNRRPKARNSPIPRPVWVRNRRLNARNSTQRRARKAPRAPKPVEAEGGWDSSARERPDDPIPPPMLIAAPEKLVKARKPTQRRARKAPRAPKPVEAEGGWDSSARERPSDPIPPPMLIPAPEKLVKARKPTQRRARKAPRAPKPVEAEGGWDSSARERPDDPIPPSMLIATPKQRVKTRKPTQRRARKAPRAPKPVIAEGGWDSSARERPSDPIPPPMLIVPQP